MKRKILSLLLLITISTFSLIAVSYEEIDSLDKNTELVKINGKWGMLKYNHIIVPFIFDDVFVYTSNEIIVTIGEKRGLLNDSGLYTLPPIYDSIWLNYSEQDNVVMRDGIGNATLNGIEGVLDENYNFFSYEEWEKIRVDLRTVDWELPGDRTWAAELFKDGVTTNKYALFDRNMPMSQFIYDGAKAFSEDLAAVKIGNKWGFIDKSLKEVVPFKYDEVKNFSEGMAAVAINGELNKDGEYDHIWGFVDRSGKEVVSPKYDYVEGQFVDGSIAVRSAKDGMWGAINKKGETIVPFIYDGIESRRYDHQLFCVWLNRKPGLINTKGKIVLEPTNYDDIELKRRGDSIVKLNGKYGMLNIEGKLVLDIIYDKINYTYDDWYDDEYPDRSGIASVTLGDKWYIVSKNYKLYTESEWEKIRKE